MRLPTTILLPFLPILTLAADLILQIHPSQHVPNPSLLPPTTHATLHASGPPATAYLTRANTFEFRNLTTGSYLLNVHCRDVVFEGLRVDVGGVGAVGEEEGDEQEEGVKEVGGKEKGELVQVWQTFRGNEWDNKGEVRGVGRGRVAAEVRAVAGKEYYQERSGFSVLSFLKSPMILMALFSLGLIVGMPYLMENMDPETRAEFEEMQKKSPLASANNPAAQLQNFDLASWMAGKSTGADEGENGGSSQVRRR
ncbi:hypothetical protein W97_00891 [Coniosporium apollinis CBS 100218]|uniref:ER membrane protein complex subunit 7 beta-sandwich domain-containing protein n=1 Tax=Coniosporium apollinis (strain CBS 100218) TaxID=1168221 RepID=R7YIE5_CONA1|nr:uncharacterized protein W97_00891 [Coniosporium apollinis CBS 100218]EON61675.1 hypothetical protein W97_00891 [Coniosporium apollinis CBS 100218]